MKILLVDDEKLALQSLEMNVRKVFPDADIEAFRMGQEALEAFRDQICDIAFLDIEMRDIHGVELAKQLKMTHPQLNIIFTTGYSEFMGDAFALHASGYVMKPVTVDKIRQEAEALRYSIEEREPQKVVAPGTMKVQTFGNFEAFGQKGPLVFKYVKTKELLAYLIDRRGALCQTREVMSVLWEDDIDRDHSSYMKNLRSDLKATLQREGYDKCIIRKRGMIAIDRDHISCDYFDWIDGKVDAINQYHGEYMSQYSWAEVTHAALEHASWQDR